jgi:hypothetical protein
VDINAVGFHFFQAQDGREFFVRTFTVPPQEVEESVTRHGPKRPYPTDEEMVEEASKAGVGEQFRQTRDSLSQYPQPKRAKSVCWFVANLPDGRYNVRLFSLEPGQGSA